MPFKSSRVNNINLVMKKSSNLYSFDDMDVKENVVGQSPKTTARCIQCHPFYYPRSRITVTSSHFTYFTTLVLSATLLFLVIFIILQSLIYSPSSSFVAVGTTLIPMVQFNRGDVDKQDVIENARSALQKLDEYRQTSSEKTQHFKDIFNKVLETLDKKEKRQFLALEALGIQDMEDFESLAQLGYESKAAKNYTKLPDYKAWTRNIELRSPNYENICIKTALTLSNPKMPIEDVFCSRLKQLEVDIIEGRELPLLTIFTWWPDPVSDTEVLSKRAVIANWDLFRPFITPVVITNHRMNMAVANGCGWPCLPADNLNKDQLPVFKDIAYLMEKTFKSTFYGYAMANSMFDSSLLFTLLSIKDRFVHGDRISSSSSSDKDQFSLLMHGKPVNMPAAGAETYESIDNFHKFVKRVMGSNESDALISKSLTYMVYRGMDFTKDAPVVVDDKHLIPYLLYRHAQLEKAVVFIDTTETVLSAKTRRTMSFNDWGRRYIYPGFRDESYNKRSLEELKTISLKSDGDNTNTLPRSSKVRYYKTLYDDKNRIRVMETNRYVH